MRQTGPLWPLLILFLAVSLAMAACGGGEGDYLVFHLEIENRSLKRDGPALWARQGDVVFVALRSDEDVIFHLHGYDVQRQVGPGAPASLEIVANATGGFPFTIHISPSIDADDDGRGDGDKDGHNGDSNGGDGHAEGADEEVELGRLEVRPR